MKLLHIKATTQTDKVNLIIDNQVISFPIDRLSQFGLVRDMEISPDFFNSIISASLDFALTNYALRLIGMLPQTSNTLRTKLRVYLSKYIIKRRLQFERSNQSGLIDQVIQKITDKGLLNQDDYVRYLINKHRRKSRQEIIFRLRHAGIDLNSLDDSLIPGDNELQNIRNIVDKKLKAQSDFTDPKTKNKLIASLVRKGFSLSLVKSVIDERLQNR